MLTPCVAGRGRGRGVPRRSLTTKTPSGTGRIEKPSRSRSRGRGHLLSGSMLTVKGLRHSSIVYKSFTGSEAGDVTLK
jgi:hypothetical protein